MPKRVGFLYEKMCDKETIRAAIIKAAENKRHRHDVQEVLSHLDKYVEKTYNMLVAETFVPHTPKVKSKFDVASQKERIIYVVPFFPDGIVHQIIVTACQGVFMRGMYPWSCAAIPKRGSSRAQRYVQRVLNQDPKGTKYVLKMDVKKFYPSINRRRLIWALARKVKDKRMLRLIWNILDSVPGAGIPIGYFICQWLANFFLEVLDWFIASLDGVKHYVRYMDDMVCFGSNKKGLHKALRTIMQFANQNLGLQIKNNWQVFPLRARPLDFVGYKQYRNYRTCRKRTFLRFVRQCRRALKRVKAGKPISPKMASALLSRAGIMKHCNSFKAKAKYYEPIGEKRLKEVVRNESKRRNCASQRIYAGVSA